MTQVTFKNNPVTLLGKEVEVGEKAPNFTVLANNLSPVTLEDSAGKTRLISVVPSLDTGVCSAQTNKFNESAASLGDDVVILTISVDLPFAQSCWCGANAADSIQTLSDHRDLSFGKAFGIVMGELRLLARSVFVIDKNGVVTYKEIVSEGTNHPDYEKALEAVKAAQ
ncbi:MAG: thiol peroxidase [Psychrobacillus sp.]